MTILIVVLVTQLSKSNPTAKWTLVGDPYTPSSTVAISDTGERVLLVELETNERPFVTVLDRQETDYVEAASTGISNPTITLTATFRQLGSLSGDGTTIAMGHPEEVLQGSESLATGYVAVYTANNNESWTLKGNPLSFEDFQDSARDYTSGFFGSSTALSRDGNRLAISITHVQSYSVANNATNSAYSSFVQVMELRGQRWEVLGPWMEGICNDGSSGCMPCEGTLGPGERDFGMALAMTPDGTRLAVGTPQAVDCKEEQAPLGGFVRVYEFTADSWKQVGSDIVLLDFNDAENYFSPREFGLSLSLSANGRRLAVGSNAGAVVLDYDGGEWKLKEDFKWSSKNTFENFNSQVALTADGKKFAFSGPESQASGGKVETLEWSGSEWKQYGKNTHAKTLDSEIALPLHETVESTWRSRVDLTRPSTRSHERNVR